MNSSSFKLLIYTTLFPFQEFKNSTHNSVIKII